MGRKGRRESAPRPGGGSDLSRFYRMLAVVAVVGVGAVVYSLVAAGAGTPAMAPVELDGLDDPASLLQAAKAMRKGSPDAPVTIAVFSDYQCPVCRYFALQVQPAVEREFVASGRARLVLYDLTLVQIHAKAFIAARAARCAEAQGRFWEYHDALYDKQPEWVARYHPIEAFVAYAKELGLDEGAFETCVDSDAHADVVTANIRLADGLGLHATPTLLAGLGAGMPLQLKGLELADVRAAMERLSAGAPEPDGG